MTELVPIEIPTIGTASFVDAEQGAKCWHADMVRLFSRLDCALARAINAIPEVSPAGTKSPQTLGSRLKRMGDFLENGQPGQAKLQKNLARLNDEKRLRNSICHGEVRTLIDKKGDWVLHFELPSDPQSYRTIFKKDAELKLKEISKTVQSTVDCLKRLS